MSEQLDASMPVDGNVSPDALPPMLRKHPVPVLGGPLEVAADPSVRRIDGGLVMVYTCLPDGEHTAICEAHSSDGLTWVKAPSRIIGAPEGTILVAPSPNTSLEVPELVVIAGEPTVFASSYGVSSVPAPGYPAELVRAGSAIETVLTPAPGPDCHGVYSAAIRTVGPALEMAYAGHCFAQQQPAESTAGLAVLRATSADGGRSWTRHGRLVTPDVAVLWQANGLAEPAWIEGDSRGVLLVSGGFGEGEGQRIAIARPGADGTLAVDVAPLLAPTAGTHDSCGAFSPTALSENGVLRIWYLAVACGTGALSIGYAEGPEAILDRAD